MDFLALAGRHVVPVPNRQLDYSFVFDARVANFCRYSSTGI